MDLDSEFDFRWDGPSSIFDWACKIIVIVVFSCVTCFEILFCGRWRDFWPFVKPVVIRKGPEINHDEGEEERQASVLVTAQDSETREGNVLQALHDAK
jgi:hypothetical protein